MSDTPRTDTVAFGTNNESLNRLFWIRELPRYVAPADFARQLERELAAVTADLEFRRELGALQQQEYDKVTAERDALKGELAELEDITGDFKPDKDSDSSGTLIERVRAIVYMAGRELTETKIEADTMRQHHANAESVIVASQQEVWRLREALEWAMSAVNPSPCRCISFVEPPHICIGHTALASTRA